MFLVNDLRGLTARFEVRAGRTPGTPIARRHRAARGAARRQRPRRRWTRSARGIRGSVLRELSNGNVCEPVSGCGDGLVVNALSSFTGGLQFLYRRLHAAGGRRWPEGRYLLHCTCCYQLDKELLGGTDLQRRRRHRHGATCLYPVVRSRNLNLFALVVGRLQSASTTACSRRRTQGKTTQPTCNCRFPGTRATTCSPVASTRTRSVGVHGQLRAAERDVSPTTRPSYSPCRLNASRLQNLLSNRLLLLVNP